MAALSKERYSLNQEAIRKLLQLSGWTVNNRPFNAEDHYGERIPKHVRIKVRGDFIVLHCGKATEYDFIHQMYRCIKCSASLNLESLDVLSTV